MQTISCTEAGTNLAGLIAAANRDREPIAITNNGGGAAVLLAADEYASMEATLHLLATPANAERIREGLADFNASKFQSGVLCD